MSISCSGQETWQYLPFFSWQKRWKQFVLVIIFIFIHDLVNIWQCPQFYAWIPNFLKIHVMCFASDRWCYLNEFIPEEVLPRGVPPEAGQQSESLLPVQQRAPHPVHIVPVHSWPCGYSGCIIHHKEVWTPSIHSDRRHLLHHRISVWWCSCQYSHAALQPNFTGNWSGIH